MPASWIKRRSRGRLSIEKEFMPRSLVKMRKAVKEAKEDNPGKLGEKGKAAVTEHALDKVAAAKEQLDIDEKKVATEEKKAKTRKKTTRKKSTKSTSKSSAASRRTVKKSTG
jgi:hypothetical protein